jgi:hypothetical protein
VCGCGRGCGAFLSSLSKGLESSEKKDFLDLMYEFSKKTPENLHEKAKT